MNPSAETLAISPSPMEAAPPSADASQSTAPLGPAEIDEILHEMTDPMNRYYRYPVAKAILPLFMWLPVTPNQITAFHAFLGVLAGYFIARGTMADLVIAFVFAEARMIFDCLDGVVARAKKLTSPNGRTIDEMGDGVGYTSMQIGALVHLYNRWPGENIVFLFAAGLLITGWMAMAYDYYKRTIASALKGTPDGPAEELVRRSVRAYYEGAGAVVKFALFFEWLQAALITPFAVPRLIARVRSEIRQGEAARGDVDDREFRATAEGIRRRARTPGLKRLLRFASIGTGDNAITVFNFGLLTGAVALVEKVTIGFGFTMFLLTTLVCAYWIKKGTSELPAR